jgi:hypothetical protein
VFIGEQVRFAGTVMIMIRVALAVFASVVLAAGTQPAAAEIYRPWCVQYGGNDGDNGTTCAFTSFEQCMMTARGGGGSCVQNPWYQAYGSGQKGPMSTGQGNRPRRR